MVNEEMNNKCVLKNDNYKSFSYKRYFGSYGMVCQLASGVFITSLNISFCFACPEMSSDSCSQIVTDCDISMGKRSFLQIHFL